MWKDRAAAQQKLTDTAQRVITAAGGVTTAMAVLAAVALAALGLAAAALIVAARRV
jgi:hypothetical protein